MAGSESPNRGSYPAQLALPSVPPIRRLAAPRV